MLDGIVVKHPVSACSTIVAMIMVAAIASSWTVSHIVVTLGVVAYLEVVRRVTLWEGRRSMRNSG